MPELIRDWLTGRTVIIAQNRSQRPNEFARLSAVGDAGDTASCPFCPGREGLTPPAVYVATDAAGRWRVRVVPNMFPAVTMSADAATESSAFGAHEVVIETPRHVDRMSALGVDDLAAVLGAYAARLDFWRRDGRLAYAIVFKNNGPQAGASLSHVHSQIIGLAQVPVACALEAERAAAFYADSSDCAYCQLISKERLFAERVVAETEEWVAFCPRASWQPFEVWILPTAHEPWFERRTDRNDAGLARFLNAILTRIESIVPLAAYNLIVRTSPWNADAECGHWRIEILPRVNSLAGFELGTGIHINPIPPTQAAKTLRSS